MVSDGGVNTWTVVMSLGADFQLIDRLEAHITGRKHSKCLHVTEPLNWNKTRIDSDVSDMKCSHWVLTH